MSRQSPFAEEWRQCLREHYKTVARENAPLDALNDIMLSVGFSDDELVQLYRDATMRADEMPDDFVPDMDIAGGTPSMVSEDGEETQPPASEDGEETQLPASEDDDPEPVETPSMASEDDEDDDHPQQLSLF